jgi:inner membrane protein
MPSYKKHLLFSLVLALPFFPDVFYLSLAVVGASIVDLDHRVKEKNLMIMALSGVLLAGTLYLLKLPFLLGIILISMALIFYVSKHRGFLHSIFGITLITAFLTILVMGVYLLLQDFSVGLKISLAVISIFLGILVLNKKLLPLYGILVLIGIILTPSSIFNPFHVFGALFLGGLSHLILDLFTPSGVGLLNPLSARRFKKVGGIVLMVIWGLSLVLVFYKYINGYF